MERTGKPTICGTAREKTGTHKVTGRWSGFCSIMQKIFKYKIYDPHFTNYRLSGLYALCVCRYVCAATSENETALWHRGLQVKFKGQGCKSLSRVRKKLQRKKIRCRNYGGLGRAIVLATRSSWYQSGRCDLE